MSKFIELAYLDGSKCFVKGISSVREERDYRLVTLQCGGSVDVINTVEEVAQKAQEYEEMLLRDEFAKSALGGILANSSVDNLEAKDVSHDSFIFAEAMLKERSK